MARAYAECRRRRESLEQPLLVQLLGCGRPATCAHLHSCDFRVHGAQAAATQAHHGVGLVQTLQPATATEEGSTDGVTNARQSIPPQVPKYWQMHSGCCRGQAPPRLPQALCPALPQGVGLVTPHLRVTSSTGALSSLASCWQRRSRAGPSCATMSSGGTSVSSEGVLQPSLIWLQPGQTDRHTKRPICRHTQGDWLAAQPPGAGTREAGDPAGGW